MEDAITAAVRKIVREEVQAALNERFGTLKPRRPVELPANVREVERQYSVKAAAELLGVSTDFIYSRITDGELPRRLDLGGTKAKYRIPASDLQRFIDGRISDSSA